MKHSECMSGTLTGLQQVLGDAWVAEELSQRLLKSKVKASAVS